MKRILQVIILWLFVGSSFGQKKIQGFGKLQLGMLISDIPELNVEIDATHKVRNMNDYFKMELQNTTDQISSGYQDTMTTSPYEYIADTLDINSTYGSFDARVKWFHFDKYYVTNNIVLDNLDLKFFNNKLSLLSEIKRKYKKMSHIF